MDTEELITDFRIEYLRNFKLLRESYDISIFLNMIKEDMCELLVSDILTHTELFEIVFKVHQTIMLEIEEELMYNDYLYFESKFFTTLNNTLQDAEVYEFYEQCYNLKSFIKIMKELI